MVLMELSPIHTERLVIRSYTIDDAALLKDAIDSSIDYLKPWLERAKQEPETLDKKKERLHRYEKMFQENKEWNYGIFNKDETLQV